MQKWAFMEHETQLVWLIGQDTIQGGSKPVMWSCPRLGNLGWYKTQVVLTDRTRYNHDLHLHSGTPDPLVLSFPCFIPYIKHTLRVGYDYLIFLAWNLGELLPMTGQSFILLNLMHQQEKSKDLNITKQWTLYSCSNGKKLIKN